MTLGIYAKISPAVMHYTNNNQVIIVMTRFQQAVKHNTLLNGGKRVLDHNLLSYIIDQLAL